MTRAEKMRENILQHASALFASRDYHTVQMDQIADSAGVSKGTLYNHFKSKDDLYLSTIKTRLCRLADVLNHAYKDREDPWRNLRSFVIHYEGFMRKHEHFFRILRKADALFSQSKDPELCRIRNLPKKTLVQLLNDGSRIGIFREHDPAVTSDLILGMIEARLLTCLDDGCDESQLETIIELVTHGLGKGNGKESL